MKADHIVYVKNQSDRDFPIQFDSRITTVPKGKTVALPYYLAQHGMDQANNPLNRDKDSPKVLVLLDEDEGSATALQDRAKHAEEQALAAQEEAKKKVEEAARLKKEAQMAKAQAAAVSEPAKK